MNINFNGGGVAESGTLAVTSGTLPRARFTAFQGSALVKMKIVDGTGGTSYLTVDEYEEWIGTAFSGDTISLVFDGQGNPASKVTGFFELVAP